MPLFCFIETLLVALVIAFIVIRLYSTSGTLFTVVEASHNEDESISSKAVENRSKPVTTVEDKTTFATTVKSTSVTTVEYTYKPVSNVTHVRFAVCSSFWEQQTNSVINMWSFQKWAKLLGYKVLEPFVNQSVLGLTDRILDTCDVTNSLRFRDYFDFDLWTDMTKNKYGIPPLEPWDTFACSPFKKTVVVLLLYEISPAGHFVDNDIDKHPVCKKKWEDFYVKHVKLFDKLNLQVIRNVCLVLERLTLKHFNSFLFPEKDDVNVWFSYWRGIAFDRIPIIDHPELDREYEGRNNILSMVKTSSTILKDARNYVNTILNVNFKEYTAIVVRTAGKRNALVNSGHSRDDVIQSLRKCLEDLKLVLLKDTSSVKMLCIDLGRFGDLTIFEYFKVNNDGNKLFKLALQIVYGNKSIDEYENEFVRAANGIEDSGYIGSMQKAIAENAKQLIAVGGHSTFQQSIVLNFKAKNGNCQDCVKHVCFE